MSDRGMKARLVAWWMEWSLAWVRAAALRRGYVLRDAVSQGRVEGLIDALVIYASEESGGLNDNRMPAHARKFIRAAARRLDAHSIEARRDP